MGKSRYALCGSDAQNFDNETLESIFLERMLYKDKDCDSLESFFLAHDMRDIVVTSAEPGRVLLPRVLLAMRRVQIVRRPRLYVGENLGRRPTHTYFPPRKLQQPRPCCIQTSM